jgi:hypothetical protein
MIRLDLLLTAIGFPLGGSVQYTSTQNTNTTQNNNNKTNIQYNNKEQKKIKSNHTEQKIKHKTSNTNLQDNKITY